ncbi:MAG: hypothetical protein ACPGU1_12880 [Myxococcota bacterium]
MMTSNATPWRLCIALSFMTGCVVDHPLLNDVMSFEVVLADSGEVQETGSDADRLPFVAGEACLSDAGCPDGQVCVIGTEGRICAKRYLFDVTAYGRDGLPFPYEGPVSVRVTPGVVADGKVSYAMVDGKLEGVEVFLLRSFGHAHVWFEVDGYLARPEDAEYGQCSDGIDNDANGLVDLADPGCLDATDDIEAPVSFVSGVSPSLWFADPTLRDLQHADPIMISTSPLVGEQVHITQGNLVVSNVVNNGFYVIDLDGNTAGDLFTSLFVFTYSKPKGPILPGDSLPTPVKYGDKICGFSGAVQEHVGHTQVVFPTFEVYWETEDGETNPACDDFPGLDLSTGVPEPWDVTDLLVREDRSADRTEYLGNVWQNSQLLEAHESNLVTFADVQLSTRFIACDRNGDGAIADDDEKACRKACTEDEGGAICTDLEGYFEFAQYAGWVGQDKKKIYGSVALAATFKPLDITTIGGPDLSGRCEVGITDKGFVEYLCEPSTLERLTGSLRHIYLCGSYGTEDTCDLQFWVIDPRFDEDVVEAQPQAGSVSND